MSYLPGLIN